MSNASASASATSTAPPTTGLIGALDASGGKGQVAQGQSLATFAASFIGAIVIFAIEFGLFLIIKNRLPRIYQPRTYLVPEPERTKSPPKSIWQWIVPVFRTSNSDFIQKCGLDAYFFLRYLRTLLKIFVPLAIVILPILLPLNLVNGRGTQFATGKYFNQTTYTNVTGLDQLSWGNIRPTQNNRYWAHLVLAVVVVVYTCYVFFDELRGYIRLRQAYLTSPQHRLCASATTVLVAGIPQKWCTYEALDGLYDVFPGGIRNIWVNRNYDDLQEKVKQRNKLAVSLESAQTSLIQNAKKAYLKKLKAEIKKAGSDESKGNRLNDLKTAADQSDGMADSGGISSGNPHQVRHTLGEALADSSGEPSREQSPDRKRPLVPIPILGQGLEAVGHGIDNLGRTVFRGLRQVGKDIDGRLNTTRGPLLDGSEQDVVRNGDAVDGTNERSVQNNTPQHDETYTLQAEHENLGQPSKANQLTFRLDGALTDAPAPTNDMACHDLHRSVEPQSDMKEGLESKVKFWKPRQTELLGIPSPIPHGQEEDEFPLNSQSPITPGANPQATINGPESHQNSRAGISGHKKSYIPFRGSKKEGDQKEGDQYPTAYNGDYDADNDGNPSWKTYLKAKDRDTMRLPIFGWQWMPSLPLIGKKVDAIDYCRRGLARLNVEIEQDQREPEKFPLMNSAFVQFNHQVAAHMACQAVSHHTPNQMAPRAVEISPDDVIWDNMSIKWWESYIRTGVVITLITGLVIGWAIPVTFTGLLSQITYLSKNVPWLAWLGRVPTWVRSIIQGILPQTLLAGLLALLPIILRLLARSQGGHTGMAIELTVQSYYFAFIFVQVTLVVSISSGITTVIQQITKSPQSIPSILAQNLPKSSNYFFSYMLLQALSTSAGALVQVLGLIQWYIFAPLMDSTARQKWRRQTSLPTMQWGTFFPVYTNLAAIGLIYSVISPLILVFNIITFSLFWLAYRYNTLYVTKFRFDTGGLLYPKAINQLFTGLYVMELCLIGLFFLVRDVDARGNAVGTPCKGQAIVMIVVLLCTILYQFLLNDAFSPLFRYLPITLEDDAVIRDEEFARAQEKRWQLDEDEHEGSDINDVLEERERRSEEDNKQAADFEMKTIEARKERGRLDPRNLGDIVPSAFNGLIHKRETWADRSRDKPHEFGKPGLTPTRPHFRQSRNVTDIEAQSSDRIGEALFSGIKAELQDLTPEERDKLVRRAFQHEALRAKRPVIWIPRDDLGVSDDEIHRTQQFSKHIWISNEYAGLDGQGKVVYRRSPPDFSEVDLIEL